MRRFQICPLGFEVERDNLFENRVDWWTYSVVLVFEVSDLICALPILCKFASHGGFIQRFLYSRWISK